MTATPIRDPISRRSYLLSLLACLAGAGLAAYGATRTWSVLVTERPGLSDLRTVQTGSDVAPALIGLALVGLAGTGALLATHGWVRRSLGGLLVMVGVGVTTGAILGRAGLDTGSAGAGGMWWPVACALGGVIIAAGGVTTLRQGHLWPSMSARYERKAPAATTPLVPVGLKPGENVKPVDNRAAWDSLDRGDDPTA